MDLQIVLGSGETRSVPLGAGGLVVGSSSGCDVVIDDAAISARHAFFQIDPSGAPTVQEMGTASPVSVNGVRISGTVALKSSDEIQIGSAVFRLAIPTAPPAAPPPAPPATAPAPPAAAPPAPPQVPVASAPAAPPAGPPPSRPTSKAGGPKMSPLIIGLIIAAVVVAIGIVVIALNMGGNDEAAPTPAPSSEAPPPSPPPTEGPSPTEPSTVVTPPVAKARVDGVYNGKYDFAFRADCPDGPCGGTAISGARFNIPYTGSSSYRGHSTIRSTCRDGGVHVQAPYKVDLTFHPIDAAMVGNKWMATKVDISLTISRKAVVKKVRTSATTITTLTCNAYHKHEQFTGVYSG